MFELVLMVLLGVLFLYLGWRIWKRKEITLIHSYHYKKVSEEDKKAYTEEMGKAMIYFGVGMILTGTINFMTNTTYSWLFFILFFILGIIKMLKAQKRYNNGIF